VQVRCWATGERSGAGRWASAGIRLRLGVSARDAGTGVCVHWRRVSAGAGQEQALEQAWRRCRRRRRVSARAEPERRRMARSEQWRAGRIQMREQQRDAGQGRARFGRARRELRRGGSGQTRTEGNEAAHDGNLARTAAEGPATRQGRGECEPGNRRKKNNHARQRTTREQVEGQWCESRTETAQEMRPGVAMVLPEATRVCRPCFCSTRA
jgi:hypothetical protein